MSLVLGRKVLVMLRILRIPSEASQVELCQLGTEKKICEHIIGPLSRVKCRWAGSGIKLLDLCATQTRSAYVR